MQHTEKLVDVLVCVTDEQEGEVDLPCVVMQHEQREEGDHRPIFVVTCVVRLHVQRARHRRGVVQRGEHASDALDVRIRVAHDGVIECKEKGLVASM